MKYLLAHEASRWTQSHYSQKAFKMINIESARRLLNKVSPEIVKHWEKEKGVGLAMTIAQIEQIEQNRQKPRTRNRKLELLVIMIVITAYILLLSLLRNSVIAMMILMIFMVASIGFYYGRLNRKDRESFQKESNEDAEQARLSDSITAFWETIFSVREHNTLPQDNPVDVEYLKGVLHTTIKDLLLKQAVLRMKNSNPSFDVDNVAAAAIEYTSADVYLDNQWETVKNELGVDIKRKEMFKKAEDEMRITHPGLSQYFKTTEGQ